MKRALVAFWLISSSALACDTSHLSLSGSASVKTCHKEGPDCIYAGQALYDYMEAIPDSDEVLTIGLQTSPWRMYDTEMRILTVEDMAAAVRAKLNGKVKRVELIGSWTSISPEAEKPSLADRVSKALGGFPVKGEDGFLWLAKDGTRRTTRQAFTMRSGAGSYFLPKGSEVLVSLVAGWPAYVVAQIPEENAEMLMHAAAGFDIFLLCPDQALAGFERAAEKGSAIAAYNAALMRLERDAEGDREAGLALLERGTALGDAKSRARLDAENAAK
jgi:hypothetical protein